MRNLTFRAEVYVTEDVLRDPTPVLENALASMVREQYRARLREGGDDATLRVFISRETARAESRCPHCGASIVR